MRSNTPATAAEPTPNTHCSIETISDGPITISGAGKCNNDDASPLSTPVSGYVGVCFTLKGWYARIWTGARWRGLGFWPYAEIAAREYDRAARAMYGPFVHQNWPLAPGLTPSCDPEADGIVATTMPAPRPRALRLACWALLLLMPHALTVAQIAVRT